MAGDLGRLPAIFTIKLEEINAGKQVDCYKDGNLMWKSYLSTG